MISRVAECCFWMLRYLERADHTARLMQVNHHFLLDIDLPELDRWQPLIVVVGERERFAEYFPPNAANQADVVLKYLTWDERNPSSIINSMSAVRENARTIRNVLSLEMWETINRHWQWLNSEAARDLFAVDVGEFMNRVKDVSSLFHGLSHETVLQEQPFVFMRLGMLLERAGQTARILDVKYHTLGPGSGTVEMPVEAAQWLALLRSCSATEPFLQRSSGAPTGQGVLEFLLKEDGFPRSVLHCLSRALSLVRHLEEGRFHSNGRRTIGLLERLVEYVRQLIVAPTESGDVHEAITRVIDDTADVCNAVHTDYFDPPPVPASRPAGRIATHAGNDFLALAVLRRTSPETPELGTPSPATATRVLSVVHQTTYRYEHPVKQSTHIFRLRPVHDAFQSLLAFDLATTPHGATHDFEDVFANPATRVDVEESYRELLIETRSMVRILQAPRLETRGKTTIPLLWMPWQRQMMLPFLLPMELPESHLRELYDYAMSFVERARYDLVETLVAINSTIHKEFAYVSGSTTVQTTPYEVFQTKRGVCQDFANLFICLAQLLNVPARYRVGYIYTGGDYENKIQSDASHAWAEVYLPWLGWRGFDPTNGCTAGLDHVRVAVGRNYRDATPTSGTLYGRITAETLDVSVRITEEGIQRTGIGHQ